MLNPSFFSILKKVETQDQRRKNLSIDPRLFIHATAEDGQMDRESYFNWRRRLSKSIHLSGCGCASLSSQIGVDLVWRAVLDEYKKKSTTEPENE